MDKIEAIKEENVSLVGRMEDLRRDAEKVGADTKKLSLAICYLMDWMREAPGIKL